VKNASDNLVEAEQIIQQIGYCAVTTNQVEKLRERITEFESQIKSLRKQLQSAEQNYQRNCLLGDAVSHSDPLESSIRKSVQHDTLRMERSSVILRDTVSQTHDLTTQMEDTMVELHKQTEQMSSFSKKMDGVNEKLKSASSLVSEMTRRAKFLF